MKYVQSGQEDYIIDGRKIALGKRQWMLVRDEINFQVYSPRKTKVVNGICIDLKTELLIQTHKGFENNDLLYNIPFYCGNSTLNDDGLEFLAPTTTIADNQAQAVLQEVFACLIEFAMSIEQLQAVLSIPIELSN